MNATCHCGAVTLEADKKPETVTQCTCSICHRYGARWAYYTRETARVVEGSDAVSGYIRGEHIEFFHCTKCGCVTHYESLKKEPDSRIAINTRMVEPDVIADVRVRTFDGADTWKYLD